MQITYQLAMAAGRDADLAAMTRDDLAAEYVKSIGYNPYAEEPHISDDEVRQTLAEWRDAVAEAGHK